MMNNNVWKIEFGKNNEEEVRKECLGIINRIKEVVDIKGLNYIETFLVLQKKNKN